jgi:hypothetical protein
MNAARIVSIKKGALMDSCIYFRFSYQPIEGAVKATEVV